VERGVEGAFLDAQYAMEALDLRGDCVAVKRAAARKEGQHEEGQSALQGIGSFHTQLSQ
jgi:hypothetical protein